MASDFPRICFLLALAALGSSGAVAAQADGDDWEARDLALSPPIAPSLRIGCAWQAGQAARQCPAGARHNEDGSTTVAIALPDGRTRAILFSAGSSNVIGANLGPSEQQRDVGGEWTGHGWTVTLGTERYEIPRGLVETGR